MEGGGGVNGLTDKTEDAWTTIGTYTNQQTGQYVHGQVSSNVCESVCELSACQQASKQLCQHNGETKS